MVRQTAGREAGWVGKRLDLGLHLAACSRLIRSSRPSYQIIVDRLEANEIVKQARRRLETLLPQLRGRGDEGAQTCVTALEKEPWDLGKITAVVLRTSDVNDRLRNIGLCGVDSCHVCNRGSRELSDVDLDRLVRDTEKLATKIRRAQ